MTVTISAVWLVFLVMLAIDAVSIALGFENSRDAKLVLHVWIRGLSICLALTFIAWVES